MPINKQKSRIIERKEENLDDIKFPDAPDGEGVTQASSVTKSQPSSMTNSPAPIPAPNVDPSIGKVAAKPFYAELGEVLYYQRVPPGGTAAVSFENLPIEQKEMWQDRAEQCLIAIDKLNHQVVRVGTGKAMTADAPEGHDKRQRNLQILTGIIRNFMGRIKTTKPALFPCEELAIHIYDGPKE